MKILLTGLTGFLGTNLRAQLPPGHEYFVIIPKDQNPIPGMEILSGDLNDLESLAAEIKTIRPEMCIHLAWEGLPDYSYEMSRKNFNSSAALFRFLVKECGCRKIVAAGSCWEYGRNFGACRESDSVEAGSYFVWAKRALCDLGLTLTREEKIDFVWLRFFYLYGPGQRDAALIPMLVRAVNKGEIPDVKTPLNANDFVYVEDAAAALIKAAFNSVQSGIYNVGSGAATPVWQVCEMIEKNMGKKIEISQRLQAAGGIQTMTFWADTAKASSLLSWKPRTPLSEGIRKYVLSLEGA